MTTSLTEKHLKFGFWLILINYKSPLAFDMRISPNQELSIYSKQTIIKFLIVFSICFSTFTFTLLKTDDPCTKKKQTILISNKIKPLNNTMFINTSN